MAVVWPVATWQTRGRAVRPEGLKGSPLFYMLVLSSFSVSLLSIYFGGSMELPSPGPEDPGEGEHEALLQIAIYFLN